MALVSHGHASFPATDIGAADVESPAEHAVLGVVERRYGLLRCDETVRVVETYERVGDLAVADRVAFVLATRHHVQLAVFERDGWYEIGALDRHLSCEQARDLRPVDGGLRLLSIVDHRGISPLVGPLG